MPMIDVYATAGTFSDKHQLAIDLATTLMEIEAVPKIPMFRQNTAGFVQDLPAGDLANVDGASNYVRVQGQGRNRLGWLSSGQGTTLSLFEPQGGLRARTSRGAAGP